MPREDSAPSSRGMAHIEMFHHSARIYFASGK